MPLDDPLTPEEQDVRDLLEDPERLQAFAAAARQRRERTPAGKAAVARCRAVAPAWGASGSPGRNTTDETSTAREFVDGLPSGARLPALSGQRRPAGARHGAMPGLFESGGSGLAACSPAAAALGVAMNIQQSVRQYTEQGFRPVPMWGVDPAGRCLCGGFDARGNPCRAGKHSPEPVETEWKERRYSPEDFASGQNVALALGPWKPGLWLVCFDFDGVDGGDIPFFTLPPTLTQKSPRGLHLFFTVPEREPLGNWNDVFRTKDADGVALDIRYARGRINVAPSRSAFGAYHWQNWREPAPLPPEVPQRIYDDRRARKLPVMAEWDRGVKAAGA